MVRLGWGHHHLLLEFAGVPAAQPQLLRLVVLFVGAGEQFIGFPALVFEIGGGLHAGASKEAVRQLSPAVGCRLGLLSKVQATAPHLQHANAVDGELEFASRFVSNPLASVELPRSCLAV